MHEDNNAADTGRAPSGPLLGTRLWETDPPADGRTAPTPDHQLAARDSLVGRRLRALRRAMVDHDGSLPVPEALRRMQRAVRDAPDRSPAWMDRVVLTAAVDARIVDVRPTDTGVAVVAGERSAPTLGVRGITLEDDDVSQLVGIHAARVSITQFGWSRFRDLDDIIPAALLRYCALAIECDVAAPMPLLAEELIEHGLSSGPDAEREAGGLLREAAIIHEELGWIEVVDIRTFGYPYVRMTALGCVGVLLLMAELEGGRPAWVDELAAAHGRLPAAEGYVDLRDLPVDVGLN